MNWRLGLDLGETSIGWCAFRLDEKVKEVESFLDAGVRIFPSSRDPKSKEPLAVARRLARQKRRQLMRKGRRLKSCIEYLHQLEIMPDDGPARDKVFALDPYESRAKAAAGLADDLELARALSHLAKRRGFRSSRKDLVEDDKTGGSLREGMSLLKEQLGQLTLGQLLWQWRQIGSGKVRFRRGSPYYPERWMYEREFDQIRAANESRLSPFQWDRLRDFILFYQRPLKPQERGKCAIRFEEGLERAPRCLPSFERYRLWECINNLRWFDDAGEEQVLSHQERQKAFLEMSKRKSLAFNSLGRKLKLPGFRLFNLDSDTRPNLEGCPTEASFKKAKFPGWDAMTLEQKDAVVLLLLDFDDDERARKQCGALGLDLDSSKTLDERLDSLADAWNTEVPVLTGLMKILDRDRAPGRFCAEILREITPIMATLGCGHDHALTKELGYTLARDEWESCEKLPYYGAVLRQAVMFGDPNFDSGLQPEKHFGKIGNPTVHVALNQLRVIVNALIERYGRPVQIVVEVARDLKMGQKAKREYQKVLKSNADRNEDARKKLIENGQAPTPYNVLKMKLWIELGQDSVDRRCVFSGKQISLKTLFAPESPVEIEHILPFSRTYDDSYMNKTLCFREANSLKGNRSPFEAFGNGQAEGRGADYCWERIWSRASKLPAKKRDRFRKDAMQEPVEGGWIARQLNDTAYISRQAAIYLKTICTDVWTIPGRFTAMLRREWQLLPLLGDDRKKNRDDMRHHSVDAFVVGLTSRSLLMFLSRLNKRGIPVAAELLDRHKSKGVLPLADLRDAFADHLDRMLVSFKPDHGVNKRFYKDTAYGIVHDDPKISQNLVSRKSAEQLKPTDVKAVRDPFLRMLLQGLDPSGLAKRLSELGVKRVRLLESNSSINRVPSASFKAYALDGYVWCDVWVVPGGMKRVEWTFVTYLQAMALETGALTLDELRREAKVHPAAKRLIRLRKNDAFRLRFGESDRVFRVVMLEATTNRIAFRPLALAGSDGTREARKSVSVLVKAGIEKVNIGPLGRERNYAPGRGDR